MNAPDIKTLLNQEIAQAYQDALQEDPKKGGSISLLVDQAWNPR